MRTLWSSVAGIVMVVGTIGGGVWTLEVRYAKAAELTVHIAQHKEAVKQFNIEVLESRRQALRARIFELEQAAKTRKGGLTPEEQRYLDETRQLYRDTTDKIMRVSAQ